MCTMDGSSGEEGGRGKMYHTTRFIRNDRALTIGSYALPGQSTGQIPIRIIQCTISASTEDVFETRTRPAHVHNTRLGVLCTSLRLDQRSIRKQCSKTTPSNSFHPLLGMGYEKETRMSTKRVRPVMIIKKSIREPPTITKYSTANCMV